MAQNREEETELKLPENPLICTPSLPSLSSDDSRSALFPDPPIRSRTTSANSHARPDQASVPCFSPRRELNRCAGCRRKVGLTGFRCRCGDLFCTEHRYSDRHDCSFDYKAAGREAIARDNPVVRPAKLLKV